MWARNVDPLFLSRYFNIQIESNQHIQQRRHYIDYSGVTVAEKQKINIKKFWKILHNNS